MSKFVISYILQFLTLRSGNIEKDAAAAQVFFAQQLLCHVCNHTKPKLDLEDVMHGVGAAWGLS